ncbi:4Fe-4S single cluster protein [Azospirillum baldaniorum]|uniref:radical SAM protein n=1 Tax=Azospirillum baldaniorum TaxID=1064539 RepID=UPI0011AAD0FB|nr:radical SAM protein [Azospirillum baldaniorum]TWA53813.1 4Fe-4S single cluster protein [Azospirillum baldaniorum]
MYALSNSVGSSPFDNEKEAILAWEQGKEVVTNNPVILSIESTSVCNLRCVMCPHAIGAVHRPKHMDQEIAGKLENFLKSAKNVQLHGIGEPLLSPAFWQFLSAIKDNHQAHIEVNSNAVLLTDAAIEKILDSNLSVINISLDACSHEMYKKIRGERFEKVAKNIQRLCEKRNERPSSKLKVWLNMTIMKENYKEIVHFVHFAKAVGADHTHFNDLNDFDSTALASWMVTRGDFTFKYAEQMIGDIIDDVTKNLQEAKSHAEIFKIGFSISGNKKLHLE